MLEKIEALRKRPKAVRDSYAFGIALTATSVIALIWLVSLPSRIDIESNVAVEESESESSFSEDLEGFKNLISDGIGDIQNQAKLIETATKELTATTSTTTPEDADTELQIESELATSTATATAAI